MGSTTIIYQAKCKDCYFHKKDHYTHERRVLTKCMYGIEKQPVGGEGRWKDNKVWKKEQITIAPKTTLQSLACHNFVLWGYTEEQVREIINQRG